MTTKQLAVYLITLMVVIAIMFGLVPPLLNAQNTFLNAIGAAMGIGAFFVAILVAYTNYNRKE